MIESAVVLGMVEPKRFNEWTRTGFRSADSCTQAVASVVGDSVHRVSEYVHCGYAIVMRGEGIGG
jgi:hypothetical protein